MNIEDTIKLFIDKNTLPFDELFITGSSLLIYYDGLVDDGEHDLDVLMEFTGFIPFDRDGLGRKLDLIRSHTIHIPNDFKKRSTKLFVYNNITVYYISLEDWACTLAIHGSHGNTKYFTRLKWLIDNNKINYKLFQKLVRKMSKDPAMPLREHIFAKGRSEFWKEFPIPEDIDD